MIRVTAPARLHFGLIHPGPVRDWTGIDGGSAVPGRRFGGCGVMLDQPRAQIRVEPASEWSVTGPAADRAIEFARRFAGSVCPGELRPQRITVEAMLPEHCGFGSGTQLALAVARGLALAAGHADWGAVELAKRVGRGARSAAGIHGFEHGGFIVDGGKRADDSIAPLIARISVPADWRWLLLWPSRGSGMYGRKEYEAMEQLTPVEKHASYAERMCRLLVTGLLPALAEGDFESFSAALFDYNALAGELFSPLQGGRYQKEFAAEMVAVLRECGVVGVGQSSWGPAVFAVMPDPSTAAKALAHFRVHSAEAQITQTCNQGAWSAASN